MKLVTVICAVAALLVCRPSFGGEGTPYAGIGGGRSAISFNDDDFGSGPDSNSKDRVTVGANTGYKIYIGYQFNPTWAVEAGYAHHGTFQHRSTNIEHLDTVFDYRARSWFLAGKASLPIARKLSLFGKLGIAVNSAKDSFSVDATNLELKPLIFGTVISEPLITNRIKPGTYSKTSAAPLLGVGFEYALGERTTLRLEYENYGRFGSADNTGRANTSLTSLGIVYSF